MRMARVIGHVVSTVKERTHRNRKILVVQPVDADGRPTEPSFLALDHCQAGIGDAVLVLQEGNSIRSLLGEPRGAVDALAVGVIDYVEQAGRQRPLGRSPGYLAPSDLATSDLGGLGGSRGP